jgi:hypothetical protein
MDWQIYLSLKKQNVFELFAAKQNKKLAKYNIEQEKSTNLPVPNSHEADLKCLASWMDCW